MSSKKQSSDMFTMEKLEDVLATDELFLNYFNEFLSLPTFPEALFFNKETGWFEIVDGAKQRLTQKIRAAVRASQKQSKIYRAVKSHSFSDLPLIPLEEDYDLGPEEIDTTFSVTTLNKEQGLKWIKEHRFPAFLQSDLYIEYRLAKIISQTETPKVEQHESVTVQIDYSPHPVKVRPEDIVDEPEDDSDKLLRKMYVCMGNASPTETEAFLSRARILNETATTSSNSGSRPISSIISSDSGISSLSKPQEHNILINSKLFAKPPSQKLGRSVTPRPNEAVCKTTESKSDQPGWRKSVSSSVYMLPSNGEEEINYEDSFISDSTSIASVESAESEARPDIIFKSVEELSTVISGTVIKCLLAEFNNDEPEVYAHHKAVRDLISDETLRNFSLTDIDNASCEWVLEHVTEEEEDATSNSVGEPTVHNPLPITSEKNQHISEGDEDSLFASDDDYEERDDNFFKRNKTKRQYPLSCKKGIDEFKDFLRNTTGERHWNLWIDIDRAKTLGADNIDTKLYSEGIREKYHKKGAAYELSLGTKQSLHLIDSSQWTLENLYNLKNKIAEPLLTYWAPGFILKKEKQLQPEKVSQEYKNNKHIRVSSARRQQDTHPEPRIASLLPLRPKSCRPRIHTQQAVIEDMYKQPTPSDYMWQPPEAVKLPETATPIGRRRTYTLEAVKLCTDHAAGRKQREEYHLRITSLTLQRPQSRQRQRPSSATVSSTHKQEQITQRARPLTASGALRRSSYRSSLTSPREITVNRAEAALPSIISSHIPEVSEENADDITPPAATDQSEVESVNKSEQSEFLGGRRMDQLLKALQNEHESGLFFRTHIEKTHNEIWLACIKFWEEVQEYHKIFYSAVLDLYQAKKKAKEIYARYVARTSQRFIGCKKAISDQVEQELFPPYEELFDDSEVYALDTLLQAWYSMVHNDKQLLHEVQTKNIVRNLETKSRLVINLQRKGFLRPGDLEPDEDPMENFEDPVYDESLMDEVPEDFRDFTLDKIIRTPIHLENFRQFLQSHFATLDLSCYLDIEQLRSLDPQLTDEADSKAKEIKQKYFNKKYFFGNNSPATREGLDNMMRSIGGWGKIFPDRPDNELIIGAQDFVRDRLSRKWLPMFLASEQFAELIRPSQSMVDAAEALLLSRQRRNQRLMKMLEGRWVSSSKEIINFRRSLLNNVVCYQFQRFVSVKSDLLENDVLFWRECQKYKHLHHQHTDESFIQQKINVIINCFISTEMTPPLQLDIPQEQADRITEKKRELGPYLFREAQLTVFRVLFEHWAEFCEFKSNTATSEILPTIERKRRRAKLRERRRQRELEEQQEKENVRRRALGLPVDGEDIYGAADSDRQTGSHPVKPHPSQQDTSQQQTDKDGEEEVKSSDGGEGERVTWSYSQYIDALDKEDIINRTGDDTFSCLSADSGKNGRQKSSKPLVDVSDLKDMKAIPPAEKQSEPEEVKPDKKSKKDKKNVKIQTTAEPKTKKATNHKSEEKLKPSPPQTPKPSLVKPSTSKQGVEKKKVHVALQLDGINRTSPTGNKAGEKSGQPITKTMTGSLRQ